MPSETCRGLWIVFADFGEHTFDLILDTGAESTHFDLDALKRLRQGGVEPGKKVTLRNGRLGPLRIERIRVRAHDLDHVGLALGRPIDGIVGMSAFRDVLLTLDYESEEVRVAKGRLPRVDDREIFRDVGSTRPMLRVKVGGRSENVLIDSGSTGQFDLVPVERLEWRVEPRAVNGAARYSRIEIDEVGRMAGELEFGPLTFEEPLVERGGRISLAGYEVLRHFVWTFDAASQRLRVRPLAQGPIRMAPHRGFGVAFNPLEAGFEVLQVFPGMPGARAGLTQGDLVSHIDGVPIHERDCSGVSDLFGRDSARLRIQRGGDTLEIDVPVEDLVP